MDENSDLVGDFGRSCEWDIVENLLEKCHNLAVSTHIEQLRNEWVSRESDLHQQLVRQHVLLIIFIDDSIRGCQQEPKTQSSIFALTRWNEIDVASSRSCLMERILDVNLASGQRNSDAADKIIRIPTGEHIA